MAKEIQCTYITAKTLYAQVFNQVGQIWNTSGTPAFETYATANIANYSVAMTEAGTASAIYTGNFPTGITTPGVYNVLIHDKAGGSNAESDVIVAAGQIQWDGAAVIPLSSRLAPATANRTLVVDANGLADANVVKLGPSGSGTAQTAKDIGAAVPSAAAGASGGLLISGSNSGTTTLGALTVSGATTLTGNVSMAAGLNVTQSSGNSSAVVFTGNGSGDGMRITGGSTGNGIRASGGAVGGAGIYGIAIGSGSGMTLIGGSTGGSGLSATGGSGDGIIASAGSGGVPIRGDITGNVVGTVSTVTTNSDMITAAQVRSAVGLASANLDTQLSAIAAYIDTEVGAIYVRIGAPAGASIAADIAAIASSGFPTAADIATAVVGKSISGPQVPGTVASYVQNTGLTCANIDTMIEDAGGGDSRFTTDALSQVTVDLSSLGGVSVEVIGPVLTVRNLRIVRNADYLVANGMAIEVRFDGVADLSSQTCKLKLTKFPERTGYWEVEAASADYSDGGLDLVFELPHADTDLDVGTYYTQFDATNAGVVTAFGQGKLEVLADVVDPD